MERNTRESVFESRHLLEHARKSKHEGHSPVASTEFIWPVDVKDSARSVMTGLFFHLMKMSSLAFLAVTLLYYSIGALFFSALYWAARSEMDPLFSSFLDAFIYSGGRMVGLDGRFDAVGAGASTIALIQAFLAMLSGAVLTGLL